LVYEAFRDATYRTNAGSDGADGVMTDMENRFAALATDNDVDDDSLEDE
jgi:hypothetical protein